MWDRNDVFADFGGGNDHGHGGGGFMPSTGTSPMAAKGESSRRAKNIFPVAIQQLLSNKEENLKIEGRDVSFVTIVGIVRKVEISTAKLTYWVDDHTGTIEAIQYVGTDGGLGNKRTDPRALIEGAYGRFCGNFRIQKGSENPFIMIFKCDQVTDANEITAHAYEVILAPIKLRKLEQMQRSKEDGFGMSNTIGSASMVGRGIGEPAMSGSVMPGFKSDHASVLKYIRQNPSESGVSRSELERMLGKKPKDMAEILESLSCEGHIYSTTDDDHFKVTDN